MDETGNRHPHDADRVAMRKATLDAAVNGALKGDTLDSIKFADAIWPKIPNTGYGYTPQCTIGGAERKILHAQFVKLAESKRDQAIAEHTKNMEEWVKSGSPPDLKPSDPLDIANVVDVSGSMGHIMQYAVVNGILGAYISNLGRWIITFDTKPQVIDLKSGDIVDWMTKVRSAPWGGSTDMGATLELVIDIMKKVRTVTPEFDGKVKLLVHTDGQFNSSFAGFGTKEISSYGGGGFSIFLWWG